MTYPLTLTAGANREDLSGAPCRGLLRSTIAIYDENVKPLPIYVDAEPAFVSLFPFRVVGGQ